MCIEVEMMHHQTFQAVAVRVISMASALNYVESLKRVLTRVHLVTVLQKLMNAS